MKYVLGIDGGGSKTVCVLATELGEVLSTATAGPANPQKVGWDRARDSLANVISAARARVSERDICTVLCAGLAGLQGPADRGSMTESLGSIVPARRIVVVGDEMVALAGAIDQSAGAVVISGTGSICVGRDPCGRIARAGGWEHLFGDEGSSYWIVIRALRAAACSFDGRGEKSVLENVLVSAVGCLSFSDLHEHICGKPGESKGMTPSEIAALFPFVLDSAKAGDACSQRILDDAGRELADAVNAVLGSLMMLEASFPVACVGSVIRKESRVRSALESSLAQVAPLARLVEPIHPPEIGAVSLAVAELRGQSIERLCAIISKVR